MQAYGDGPYMALRPRLDEFCAQLSLLATQIIWTEELQEMCVEKRRGLENARKLQEPSRIWRFWGVRKCGEQVW